MQASTLMKTVEINKILFSILYPNMVKHMKGLSEPNHHLKQITRIKISPAHGNIAHEEFFHSLGSTRNKKIHKEAFMFQTRFIIIRTIVTLKVKEYLIIKILNRRTLIKKLKICNSSLKDYNLKRNTIRKWKN